MTVTTVKSRANCSNGTDTVPRSRERILVKKFESRPVLMSKHHDSLLLMVLYRKALDRLCVRLNMYLVLNILMSVEEKYNVLHVIKTAFLRFR